MGVSLRVTWIGIGLGLLESASSMISSTSESSQTLASPSIFDKDRIFHSFYTRENTYVVHPKQPPKKIINPKEVKGTLPY